MSSQTKLEHPATLPTAASMNLHQLLERDGYVIIPSALNEAELKSLRDACHHVAELARAGKWPYIRTLPKQFPPWGSDPSNGIWGVQHLLHPAMPEQELFAASYFADDVAAAVKEIIGGNTTDDDLVMELYNLLVRPDEDFELRWHRDDIAPTATAEEELEKLRSTAWHAQWNLALYNDSSLVVVPGTHKRARTETERNADPFESNMPGQMVVGMKAGDIIFYNNNIFHRGVYNSKVERMTLHGSVGHVKGGNARARNVLQHGVGEWVDKVDFSGLPPNVVKRAENMRARLKKMGEVSGDVGFAHEHD
jgi:ectoine hydroxylase-related dioxygenase (phytanoyl-CoA dioxygenase family)